VTPEEYQAFCRTTAVYPPEQGLTYTALGLAGEAGEVANQVKKAVRDDGGAITPTRLAQLKGELGDVCYYVAALCSELGLSLAGVIDHNVEKLTSRRARGVLKGEGGER
jgi:NTP pyrophosphatase (non-canonical NTP hydrolase)